MTAVGIGSVAAFLFLLLGCRLAISVLPPAARELVRLLVVGVGRLLYAIGWLVYFALFATGNKGGK